ncbi:MAG: hflC 2 [Hydrocarboniphaga sp.]|uniref:SPFH domain-containing protein n=1 Tax=Hydrocarboniphaga sp. TaxID=2033016 RepID=UPI0026023C8D|nr:SPFH domain-containing protein [Hydrocarboniphaga sp.]MDB5968231.1 hflC 2 [Hydrocarboniphaga sp.]
MTGFESGRPMSGLISSGVAAVIAVLVLLMSYTSIDQGERGVHLRFGKIVGIMEPGANWKIPFVDSVRKISVQNNSQLFEKVDAYSFDQQTATMRVSVNYHIPSDVVEQVYAEYGNVENTVSRLIDRNTPTVAENTFGQYTALKAVQDRTAFVRDVATNLRAAVKGPIVVDSVQIENIDFSNAYESSIEERMKAEVTIQTQKQNLETERVKADIAVTQAKARAESALAEATAKAEGTRITGEAEASAIRAKGEALRQNAALVELTAAERWNGVLPTTMVPGGTVPYINLK